MLRSSLITFATMAATLLPRGALASPYDTAFTTSTVLAPTGAAGTTAMAWAPDGSNRLFFTRQIGQLKVLVDGVVVNVAR